MSQSTILNHQEINHKIKRIAYQIYETFVEEDKIIIAGISKNGYLLAQEITTVITQISNKKIILCEVFINKQNPKNTVTTSISSTEYENQNIVLIDDVLNSGATLIYGVKHFLEVSVKKLKTAVLIDRNHKKFPIKADFKGLSLSTSLHEHVSLIFETDNNSVVLS